jgi:hypothetical protein
MGKISGGRRMSKRRHISDDHGDDDDAPLIEEIPLIVAPGRYYIACDKVRPGTWRGTYTFTFRIVSDGEFYGVRVPAYLKVTTEVPAGLQLQRWVRLLADYTGLPPSKCSRQRFTEFYYEGEVGLVTTNYKHEERRPDEQYAVVRDLLEVAGKLSDIDPANAQPDEATIQQRPEKSLTTPRPSKGNLDG